MGLNISKYRHLAIFQKCRQCSKIIAHWYSKNVADIQFILLFLVKTWLKYRQSDKCHLYSDFNEVTVPWRAQKQFEVTTRRRSGSQDRTIMKMPSFEMGKHGLHVERGRTHIPYTGSSVVEINGGWCCFEQVPGCARSNPERKHEHNIFTCILFFKQKYVKQNIKK